MAHIIESMGFMTSKTEFCRNWKINRLHDPESDTLTFSRINTFSKEEKIIDSKPIQYIFTQLKIYCTEPIDISISENIYEEMKKVLDINFTSYEELFDIYRLLCKAKEKGLLS